MTCPNCGLNVESPVPPWCPRCGQPLILAQVVPPDVASHAPGTPTAQGGEAVPLYPQTAPPALAPLPPPPPGQPSAYTPYPGYPPGYGVPYGPAAPPSYGPGYAPPAPPGYVPQWSTPGILPPSPTAPRKRARTLAIGSMVTLAIILIVAIAGGSIYVLRQRTTPRVSVPPAATPTATPLAPGMNGRAPLVNDSLKGDASEWPTYTNCFDSADGYHIKQNYYCYPGSSNVDNATISVQGELLTGPLDMLYGIAFRILSQPHHFAFYFFGVSAGGDWTFGRDDNGTWTTISAREVSGAIQPGLQVFTTLTVNATGTHFDFYIGRTQVGSADDSALSSGYSGLSVFGTGEAVFTNFLVAN